VLTVSGELQHEWVVGVEGGQDGVLKFKEKGVGMHYTSYGPFKPLSWLK